MVRFLIRNGVRKGFLGGSRPWAIIGGLALGGRWLKRLARRQPETVYCEELAPGQSLVISSPAKVSRRGRRRGR